MVRPIPSLPATATATNSSSARRYRAHNPRPPTASAPSGPCCRTPRSQSFRPVSDTGLTAQCHPHRQHPAEEVYVTGTFDNWTKSVKLVKEGDVFQKKVDLEPTEKIYYKVGCLLGSLCVSFLHPPIPLRRPSRESLRRRFGTDSSTLACCLRQASSNCRFGLRHAWHRDDGRRRAPKSYFYKGRDTKPPR